MIRFMPLAFFIAGMLFAFAIDRIG